MPTRDEVREILPELELIENEQLREKTMDVWVEAMETGGWEVADADAQCQDLTTQLFIVWIAIQGIAEIIGGEPQVTIIERNPSGQVAGSQAVTDRIRRIDGCGAQLALAEPGLRCRRGAGKAR